MIRTKEMIFASAEKESILELIDLSVKQSNESIFWQQKALPLANAILSVLIPLQRQQLLFTPEGVPAQMVTPELFFTWCDLYSLRALAFTLQKSNDKKELVGTKYTKERAQMYEPIPLDELGSYLSSFMVDLENEMVDFPITHYNLHIGILDVLKKALK